MSLLSRSIPLSGKELKLDSSVQESPDSLAVCRYPRVLAKMVS